MKANRKDMQPKVLEMVSKRVSGELGFDANYHIHPITKFKCILVPLAT